MFRGTAKPDGTADGGFEKGVTLKTADGKDLNVGRASAVAVTDWDGDGDLDLVVGTLDGNVFLVPNEGGVKTPRWGKEQALAAGGKEIDVAHGDAGPCLADWDGDGRMDLLVGAGDGGVLFFRNTAKSGVPVLAAGRDLVPGLAHASRRAAGAAGAAAARPSSRSKPAVCDWDGDGHLDLLVGDFESRQSPAPALTEDQVADRDILQAQQQRTYNDMGAIYNRLQRKVAGDMGLDADMETPEDKVEEFQRRVGELLTKDEAYQEVQARLERIRKVLDPLVPRHEMHGRVWFYRRLP